MAADQHSEKEIQWHLGSEDEDRLRSAVSAIVVGQIQFALSDLREKISLFLARDKGGNPYISVYFGEYDTGDCSGSPSIEELKVPLDDLLFDADDDLKAEFHALANKYCDL